MMYNQPTDISSQKMSSHLKLKNHLLSFLLVETFIFIH